MYFSGSPTAIPAQSLPHLLLLPLTCSAPASLASTLFLKHSSGSLLQPFPQPSWLIPQHPPARLPTPSSVCSDPTFSGRRTLTIPLNSSIHSCPSDASFWSFTFLHCPYHLPPYYVIFNLSCLLFIVYLCCIECNLHKGRHLYLVHRYFPSIWYSVWKIKGFNKYLLNGNFWKWCGMVHQYLVINHRKEDVGGCSVLSVPRGHSFLRAPWSPPLCPHGEMITCPHPTPPPQAEGLLPEFQFDLGTYPLKPCKIPKTKFST